MGDKASECKLGSCHGADFVGDLHDSKIYIRWYVVKMWWKQLCRSHGHAKKWCLMAALVRRWFPSALVHGWKAHHPLQRDGMLFWTCWNPLLQFTAEKRFAILLQTSVHHANVKFMN